MKFLVTALIIASTSCFAHTSYLCERAKLEARNSIISSWSFIVGNSCDEIIGGVEFNTKKRIAQVNRVYGNSIYSKCYRSASRAYLKDYALDTLSRCSFEQNSTVEMAMEKGHETCLNLLESGQFTGVITDVPELEQISGTGPAIGIVINNNEYWEYFLELENKRGFITGCSKAEYDYIRNKESL